MTGRERPGGGDRDREAGYRSGYGGRGNFRGRGGSSSGYKPRRYWDNDEYYKEDRGDRGGRRRRRSYSRSRSRSASYSSRSRSRSRTPPPRRGRSRSRSPQPPEEYVPRSTEHNTSAPVSHGVELNQPEPYIPSNDPVNSWNSSTMMPMSHTNGQALHQAMNPYGDSASYHHPPQYQETQGPLSANNQAAMSYGYMHNVPVAGYHRPPPPAPSQPLEVMYPQPLALSQTTNIPPPPPVLSEMKEENNESSKKTKKDKRKKKKRHHSSSSSSSSSDDSSDSRRRRKSKKDRGNSDSSSEEEKKDSAPASNSGLTGQQKDMLLKQREGYQMKLEVLEREIDKLRSKKDELMRGGADRQLVEENEKLQADLKGRYKAVVVVLEKIDDVLRVGGSKGPVVLDPPKPLAVAPRPRTPPTPSVPIPKQTQGHSEPKGFSNDGNKSGLTAFDYFDNRQHWCRLCNVFPDTVEAMLSHFHSKEHHDQIQQLGIDEKPWHKRNAVSDSKPMSGARKAPLRGMQFFSPVQGWYCRLCDNWMGDPHCAVEHLKSDEHNSNYMGENVKSYPQNGSDDESNRQAYVRKIVADKNFLDEHPGWEGKWASDREKALSASGNVDVSQSHGASTRRSRFDEGHQSDRFEKKPSIPEDNMESGKSIRVQMRNALKSEEKSHEPQFSPAMTEARPSKDSGIEEWMTKPKVAVDIIDTQKFAEIVRQKHGTKEKEIRETKGNNELEVKLVPAVPMISSGKDIRDAKRDDRRRTEKVELQISSRDKDRDIRDRYRERERESRNSRRRSRSRSRSRDRRYTRRRSRSRSRSRSRDRERSDRDRDRERRDRDSRTERDRDRPDIKEAVKKLPMIGKMPLYKRPVFTKDKQEPEESKQFSAEPPAVSAPIIGSLRKESFMHHHHNEESRVSAYSDNSMSNPPFNFETHASSSVGEYGSVNMVAPPAQYGSLRSDIAPVHEERTDFHQNAPGTDDLGGADSKNEGKEKDDAPAALPDDFQQALDIIYSVNTGSQLQQKSASIPQPVPPPTDAAAGTSNEGSEKVPTDAATGEYGSSDYASMGTNGYNSYMGYQPYQQSFEGYAPYEELDDGPPGVGDDLPPGVAAPAKPPPIVAEGSHREKVEDKDPPPPGDDDMEDLRMLGIDVDDTAVVKH